MEEEGKYHPDNMLPDGTINQKYRSRGNILCIIHIQ